jgi:hypothetical protein
VDLPPEPVALDQRVHQAEKRLARARGRRRREHHPRARAPTRPALVEKAPDAVQKAEETSIFPMVVDSPPRHYEPQPGLSGPRPFRTSTGSTPSPRRISACSRKSP